MSHFTVLVPAHNEDDLYEKLIPYYEYGCSNEDDEALKSRGLLLFKIKYQKDNFEQDARAILAGLDGDEDYYERYAQYIKEGAYTSLFKDWDGGNLGPDENWGYWEGKDEKWDWYLVGGRWTGLLKLKPIINGYVKCPYCGFEQKPKDIAECGKCGGQLNMESFIPKDRVEKETGNGRPGVMTSPNHDPTRCDYAPAGFVDWDGILAAQLDNTMKAYFAYHECLAQAREIISEGHANLEWEPKWEGVWSKAKETYESDGKNCSKHFHSLDDYVLHSIADSLLRDRHIHLWDTFQEAAERFYKSEDEYREMFSGNALTYAFIDLSGKWNQRGEMGWFGMDDKSKGTDNYDEAFWQFVKSLPPEQRIYVVDCHI